VTIASKEQFMTVEEYLAFEEKSPIRHEYVDGRVCAMTGVILKHNLINNNANEILRKHVKGSPCRAYTIDVKVHVAAANSYYYPDVIVDCGVIDEESLFAANPVLIVEVLSRSTRSIDRREKALAYRKLPSLCEYLILNHRRKHAELHRKNDSGEWTVFVFRNNDVIEFLSMPVGPLKVSLQRFYEDTKLEHQPDLQVKEDAVEWSIYDDDEEEDDEDEDVDY
jgi:Uma2 family endonuclease